MTKEEVTQLIRSEVQAAMANVKQTAVEAAPEIVRAYRANLQDNDAGNYSAEAREWAIANGIFNGGGVLPDDSPNYMWEDLLTREQCATILYRFAQARGLT